MLEVQNIHPSQKWKEKQQTATGIKDTDKCIVIWSQKPPVMEREEASAFVFQVSRPYTSGNTPNFKAEPLPSTTRHVLVINTSKMSQDSVFSSS